MPQKVRRIRGWTGSARIECSIQGCSQRSGTATPSYRPQAPRPNGPFRHTHKHRPAKAQAEPAAASEFSCCAGCGSFSPSKEAQIPRTGPPSPAQRNSRPHTDIPDPIKRRTGRKTPAGADHWSERAGAEAALEHTEAWSIAAAENPLPCPATGKQRPTAWG